jgi:hypothetical protein
LFALTGLVVFIFFIVLAHCCVFRLLGRVAFLCLSKEKAPKERIPNMPALRVPCDARMSRRDAELAALRQTHPELPGSSCASRRA